MPEASTAPRRRVLAITNLFGYPWDRTRATFNQQQFDRLSKHVDLQVLVAVPWPEALRNFRAYRKGRRPGETPWPYADYFIYWYLPGPGRILHVPFFFLSALLQRFPTLMRGWDCLLGSWGYPDAIATALLGKLTGTPVVAKVHGSDINLYGDMASRRWQIRAGLNLCRSVVAVSAPLAARLEALGVRREGIRTIFNGVDLQRFHPRPRAEARSTLGIEAGTRMILYVGNLLRSKGCHDLFEAFAGLADLDPSLQLFYVGAGGAQQDLHDRATARDLGQRVSFAGKVPHDVLVDWFAACDVFCLPSHGEGIPNVVLEAMGCGVPVVATRVGGIPDVLPEFAGILVPAHDVEALRRAIGDVLVTEWNRARIRAHAARFDWETNIRSLLELL